MQKTPAHCIFDGKFSLAKVIIFTKLGEANSIILKMLAAGPYMNFDQESPPI